MIARGEYDARAQILIDNKVHAGQRRVRCGRAAPGWPVAALCWSIAAGRRGRDGALVSAGAAAAGLVNIAGRLNVPAGRYLELRTEHVAGRVGRTSTGALSQRDRDRGAAVVIEQTVAPVPPDGLVRDWAAPDFGIEGHHGYMIQWYALAALVDPVLGSRSASLAHRATKP